MINKLHLHMFDEGVASGSASVGSAETGSTSVGGSEAQAQVVYGREEPQTDNNDSANHGSSEVQPRVETPNLNAEFNELISGKYKEQYGAKLQEAIQNRFKNSADYEGQVNQYKEIFAPLAQMYGLEIDDIDGLKNVIWNEDGLLSQYADREGLSVDKAKQFLEMKTESAYRSKVDEEIELAREERETQKRWESEAAELQQYFPNFNLKSEIASVPGFGDYLQMGLSVNDAFYLAHRAEIMQGASSHQAQQTQAQTIQNFQNRAARPVENGMNSGPAIMRKADPSKFDKNDVMEVIRQARAGKKITF